MTVSPSTSDREDHAEAQHFAAHHGLEHEHDRRDLTHHWDSYPFGLGSWRRARNVVRGTLHGRSITAFEYHYVLLSDNTTERDAFRNFLICVVDLDHPVPPLTAVLRDRGVWHEGELAGTEFPVNHEVWRDRYLLVGDDDDFARAVVTAEHAARCAEIDARVEWRFAGDDFLLWMENVRVGDGLSAALEVLLPLITAAEGFRPQERAPLSARAAAPRVQGRQPTGTDEKELDVNTYRIHIRSDEFEYESEVHASNVEKEDGWTIFWNGNDVFMRIRDEHIVSLEHLI